MKDLFFHKNFLTKLENKTILKEKKNLKKISIVMPSFNKAEFIERSILSVLNQDYQNIELIIIDGGSTDGTIEIIKKYEKHISFWISEKDKGQSDALNKGFKYCSGSIYGFLNSDDVYMPGSFKQASLILKNNLDKKIVFGDWLSIDKEDKIVDYNHAFDFNLNHFKYEGFHLSATSMFWRSEVHKRFSGFDNNLYRKVSNDIESTWELIPNTDNIIYVIYQLENTFENDKIIAVDSQGRLNENIYNQLGSEPFKLVANDNETFPVLKVWFDKNGFMLGIGTNFKMYRKATTDWRNSEFDTVTGSNPSLINDAIYGKDGKMYGLVLIPKLGKIAVMKQKMVYYLSQFIPLEFISDKNNKEIISNSEVVKFKTGIDYTNDRYNDLQYGDINISEAKNKLKIEELRKIRSHCASRGSKTNVEHENYEFLNRLTKQQKHIDELNGVLSKMVSQDPSRSKIQEDII